MPAFPDPTEPLRSSRVELRLEAERDIPEVLIAHQDDPDLYGRLGLERPPSGAELGRRVEGGAALRARGEGIRFTLLEPGSDICEGQLDVHEVAWPDARAQAGIWVSPAARGRGLARDALGLVARWLFESCAIERLELLPDTGNAALTRAAQAAGFRHEGVLRSYVRERGHRNDVLVLSLLPRDPVPA